VRSAAFTPTGDGPPSYIEPEQFRPYRPRRNEPVKVDPTKQKKSPAAQVRQRLAAWVRELGVRDPGLSPNHAWRHTFKQIGRRSELDNVILDKICGHTVARVLSSSKMP
jgi:hypothetical protein